MRVTTAFNRMLGLPGAWVESVSFEDTGVVVGIKARGRRLRCPCGYSTSARYDSSRRRWRHLDLGACSLWLEADIRRLVCRPCARVRTEEVAWARPGARHTRDFEDVVACAAGGAGGDRIDLDDRSSGASGGSRDASSGVEWRAVGWLRGWG